MSATKVRSAINEKADGINPPIWSVQRDDGGVEARGASSYEGELSQVRAAGNGVRGARSQDTTPGGTGSGAATGDPTLKQDDRGPFIFIIYRGKGSILHYPLHQIRK